MEKKPEITIHNIKSNKFRHSHADGASASLTPHGYININFFSERNAIPKGTVFVVNDDGKLGEAKANIPGSKIGLVREFDFGVYLDVEVCKRVVTLLNQKIKEHETYFSKDKK